MIYNQPSIYNQGGGGSGGGGGAYQDGGELTDAEIIKVENNTISTYQNTTRDEINFYFEVTNEEIINSVVEVNTTKNSTVYVYIYKNGLYYLLGNIGGDTISANGEYNINIVGNSYSIETVTPAPSTPSMIALDGISYQLVYINGLLWATKNFRSPVGTYFVFNNEYYYRRDESTSLNAYINSKNGKCRLPTYSEFSAMIVHLGGFTMATSSKMISNTGWSVGAGNGTNESGLNIKPLAYVKSDGTLDTSGLTNYEYIMGNGCQLLMRGSNYIPKLDYVSSQESYNARFVVDP